MSEIVSCILLKQSLKTACSQEGLFDRHEYLDWLIQLPDKMKNIDDVVLKLILTQLNTVSF